MLRRIKDRRPARDHRHRLRPSAEGLEDRMLLYATLGGNWVHGDRITFSFAPDGTSIGGIPSALHQRMAQLGIPEQAWKDEFRKAAAAWQNVAGINFVEVPDSGDPFSVAGNQQGDSRFGDIRIAGTNMGTGVLGSAFLPPPFNGGTLAGDIVMNTAAIWNVQTTYNIMTVALHEFGHSLGMDHSAIETAVTYAYYNTIKLSLTTDDVAGIRSIYGPRQPDRFDAVASNQTMQTATNLNPYLDASAQVRLDGLDIATTTDLDWYSVTAPPSTTGTLTVTMQSLNLSMLNPRIVVYASSGPSLGMVSASTKFGGVATFSISGFAPGQGFIFRAQADNSGPGGSGAYALLVNFGAQPLALYPPPDTVVPEQPNQYGRSSNMQEPGGPPGLEIARQKASDKARGLHDRPSHHAHHEHEHGLIQIGDLIGYGGQYHIAPGHAHTTGEPPRPGPGRAPAAGLGADPSAILVLVGMGEDLELTSPLDRARGRAQARAIDFLLASWGDGATPR